MKTNPYQKLLEEIKKNHLNYAEIENLLQDISLAIADNKFPSQQDFFFFLEALEIIKAKSSFLKKELDKARLKKRVISTYKPSLPLT